VSIDARPGKAKRWLTGTNRGNIPIVRPGEVTFEIKLKTAGYYSFRSGIEPFEIDSQAQRPRFQMKLR
jgi:hypothetical protein